MAEENIIFFENDNKSYSIVDLHINSDIYFDYEDSYNYYDINLKKIILINSYNKYFIRYYDLNKMMIVPLQQLKINNSYNKTNVLKKKKMMRI